MSIDETGPSCFFVEWYRREFVHETLERTAAVLAESAASVSAAGVPVQLIAMLALPSDEVLFAVFNAFSAGTVEHTCTRVGMPTQRLTTAIDAHIGTNKS